MPTSPTGMPHPRTPGRRSFLAGSVFMLLLGVVHGGALLNDQFGTPPAQFADLNATLRNTKFAIGPLTVTAFGLVEILSFSYSFLALFVGASDLIMLKPAIDAGRLRALTLLNALLALSLFGVAARYQFPPPAVFTLGALVCFSVSLVRQSGAPGSA